MALSRLLIRDFRNIVHADLPLNNHFNFLIGANGSGKSSVLEAIYTLGHGRAFRSSNHQRVIRDEQMEFVLHGQWQQGQQTTALGLSKNRLGESRIRIAGKDNHKIADLAALLPMQLITPEGFTLLTGGPKYRRAFVDWGCFHSQQGFFEQWNKLKRVLKQRNAALRQVQHYRQLAVWDQALIPLAEQVSLWREAYCLAISEQILTTCQQFLPEYQFDFQLYRGWDKHSDYAQLLVKQFERDKGTGFTQLGPHKADFRLRANQTFVEDRLSRGQMKLLMCALRLAQGEFLTKQTGLPCLYLLDDFASELDEQKRQLLAQRLQNTQAQVFVSAITVEQISEMTAQPSALFQLVDGDVRHYSD